jgi:ribosomal-protein-serine acetyltransferase
MFSCTIDDDASLRVLEEGHAEELFALIDRNRAHLRTYMEWMTDDYAADDTRKFIRLGLTQLADAEGLQAGIWSGNQLAGHIGYFRTDKRNRRTSIGYWIGAEFEGRGLITRACRLMIDYAFEALDMHRVEIGCAVDNLRSRAIPEKFGFRPEGVLRQCDWMHGRFLDIAIYGMLAPEWRALKRQRQTDASHTNP